MPYNGRMVRASVVDSIRRELQRQMPDSRGDMRSVADVIARRLVLRALEGDLSAIQAVIDRVDGRPLQSVTGMIGVVTPETSPAIEGALRSIVAGMGLGMLPEGDAVTRNSEAEVIDVDGGGATDGGASEAGDCRGDSTGGESGPGDLCEPDDRETDPQNS